jgi:hypothetical protein
MIFVSVVLGVRPRWRTPRCIRDVIWASTLWDNRPLQRLCQTQTDPVHASSLFGCYLYRYNSPGHYLFHARLGIFWWRPGQEWNCFIEVLHHADKEATSGSRLLRQVPAKKRTSLAIRLPWATRRRPDRNSGSKSGKLLQSG